MLLHIAVAKFTKSWSEDSIKNSREIKTDCSLATFYKFKSFDIGPPTEWEKESCLCVKCQNTHLLLKGINNFRNSKKLNQLDSVTEFLMLKESYVWWGSWKKKSTQNSLHQRKHHIVYSRKKLRYTLKMEKRKVMSKLHASTRVAKWVALFNS